MSVGCNDNFMSSSLSNGEAQRSPYIKTEVRLQQLSMDADLAPSLSRSQSHSMSSGIETTNHDVNRELTNPSSPRSRNERLPRLPPLFNSPLHPKPTSAISLSYNNNNIYYNQDVRSVVNASSSSFAANQSNSRNAYNPHSIESPNFHPPSTSQNVAINQVNRFRSSNQVFFSTSDLAAHYGIPTSFPPIPRTTPRNADSHTQPSEPEFAFLCNNYLTMLSQKPGEANVTEDPVRAPVHDSTAQVFRPAPSQDDAVQALMDVLQGDSNDCAAVQILTSGSCSRTASPEMRDQPDFSEYLTSPYDDSPFDDDLLLTTPALSTLDMGPDILTSPVMDGWGYADEQVFNEFEPEPALFPLTKPPVDDTPPLTVSPALDLDGMWSMPPHTPPLDRSYTNSSQPLSTKPHRRRSTATGTRKNVTPESLVPIDAPTQPRKYVTPSVTSRKEVPAIFARKRARSQAFGDEEDQLEDEVITLPPNPTEQELIEAKRRQNTIAARRSRKRKLEYQRELEDTVEALREEKDVWKTRALTCHALLKSHGLHSEEFFDS